MSHSLPYAAGFFDGEGCITIHHSKIRREYALQVMVSNTHRGIMDWWTDQFGGHLLIRDDGRKNCHRLYTWQQRSRKAAAFLRTIEPYLQTKRPEALLGLQFQQAMIAPRTSRRLSEAQFAERQGYKETMAVLKRVHLDPQALVVG